MTERITRTYDVQWEVYVPYSRKLEPAIYGNVDEAIEAARQILLNPSTPSYSYVQISRKEAEIEGG